MDAVPCHFIDNLCYIVGNEILKVKSRHWKSVSAKHRNRQRFHLVVNAQSDGRLRYAFATTAVNANFAAQTETLFFSLGEVATISARHFWLVGIRANALVPAENSGFEISLGQFRRTLLPFVQKRLFYQGMKDLTLLTTNEALQTALLDVYGNTHHFRRLSLGYTSKSSLKFLKSQIANNTRLRNVYLDGNWTQSLLPLIYKMVISGNVGCDIANTPIDLTFAFVAEVVQNFKRNGGRLDVSAHCEMNEEDMQKLCEFTGMKTVTSSPGLHQCVLQRNGEEFLYIVLKTTLLGIYSNDVLSLSSTPIAEVTTPASPKV